MIQTQRQSQSQNNDLNPWKIIGNIFFSKTVLWANIIILLICFLLGMAILEFDRRVLNKDLANKAHRIEQNLKKSVEEATLIGEITAKELLEKGFSNISEMKKLLAEKNEALQRKFSASAVRMQFCDPDGIPILQDKKEPFLNHHEMELELPIKENDNLIGYLRVNFSHELLDRLVNIEEIGKNIDVIYTSTFKQKDSLLDIIFKKAQIKSNKSDKFIELKYNETYLNDILKARVLSVLVFYVFLSLLFLFIIKININAFNKILMEKYEDRMNEMSSKIEDMEAVRRSSKAAFDEYKITKDLALKTSEIYNELLYLISERLQSTGKNIANATRMMLNPSTQLSTEQTLRISENMLDKSFLPSGIPLSSQKLSLVGVDALINEALTFHGERIFKQNIKINFRCLPPSDEIESDAMALKLMFVSLLNTSIEASQKNGFIHITIEKKGDRLNVDIEDNGYLLDGNTLKKLCSHHNPYKMIILDWGDLSQLADTLRADIQVNENFPKGRVVSVSFPLTLKKEKTLTKGGWDGNVYQL